MARPYAIGPSVLTRRATRIPLLLVVAMVLAEALDRLADAATGGGSVPGALLGLAGLPQLAGLGAVAVLGAVAARREAQQPCSRLSRRLLAMVGVLLCGLVVQELVAVLGHADHADGLGGLAAHAATVVLPAAAACGLAVALAVGVAHVVRRAWPALAAAPSWRVPRIPRPTARTAAALPPGPLLARHLAGRAPPAVAG